MIELDGANRSFKAKRAKSSLRLKYEAETHVIERKIGDLESIRARLGLSQRKMAQLLLVDPSAWTRWTKGEDEAPPHIYRMLQWYLALEEKYPVLDVNFWLNTVAQVTEKSELSVLTLSRQHDLESADRRFAASEQSLNEKLADQLSKTTSRFHSLLAERENSLRRYILVMSVVATFVGCAIGLMLAQFIT